VTNLGSSAYRVGAVGALLVIWAASAESCLPPIEHPCGWQICADVKVTAADNGHSFNMQPGQTLLETISGADPSSSEVSSDDRVIKKNFGPEANGIDTSVSFVAVGAGSAEVTLRHPRCTDPASTTCAVTVDVTVIAIPSTQRQLSESDSGSRISVRRGDRVLITFTASDEHYWNVTIQPAGPVIWQIPPTLFAHGSSQGVLEATSVGMAKFDAVAPSCAPTNTACVREVIFYFAVGL
jgi:hypothetical protein